MSDTVVESLVPKICASLGGEIARVLVLPLLWAAFEGETSVNGYTVPLIPPQLASHIKDCWVAAGNSPDMNPIEKISLSVQQMGDQLVIVPICTAQVDGETGRGGDGDVDAEEDGGRVVPAANAGSDWPGKCGSSLDMDTLFSQQYILQQRMEDLRQEMISLFGVQRAFLRNMNTNVKRIAAQPVLRSYPIIQRRSTGHSGGANVDARRSTGLEAMTEAETRSSSGVLLSRNPKDLYTVWKEWDFGLYGMKPARDFTIHERGANKFTFSRRKNIWDAVIRMIAHGYTSDTAIDRIYDVYGRGKSVCAICKALAKDRRDGIERLL